MKKFNSFLLKKYLFQKKLKYCTILQEFIWIPCLQNKSFQMKRLWTVQFLNKGNSIIANIKTKPKKRKKKTACHILRRCLKYNEQTSQCENCFVLLKSCIKLSDWKCWCSLILQQKLEIQMSSDLKFWTASMFGVVIVIIVEQNSS